MDLALSMDYRDANRRFVILGGGAAGLAAANHLLDRGIQPTLIDAGHYPRHRVCGEFFSGEVASLLEEWGIIPGASISHVQFQTSSLQKKIPLPTAGFSLSHYSFDTELAKRIEKGGGVLKTGIVVNDLIVDHKNGGGQLILSNGEEIVASHLFIGTEGNRKDI